MRNRTLLLALLALVASIPALPSGAAEPDASYPQKPIRMVVPFPTGFASDFLARVVSQKLSEQYGKQIIVDLSLIHI